MVTNQYINSWKRKPKFVFADDDSVSKKDNWQLLKLPTPSKEQSLAMFKEEMNL